jgi:hypothetical protein
MLITRSAFSHVVTRKGNQPRETSWLVSSEEGLKSFDDEEVSPSNNANSDIQPRYWKNRRLINLSVEMKSATRTLITCAQCSWVVRGNRRERASKDYRHVSGDPTGQGRVLGACTQNMVLNFFWEYITSWGFIGKSERLIVAMKGSNVLGAKGSYFNHVSIKEGRPA